MQWLRDGLGVIGERGRERGARDERRPRPAGVRLRAGADRVSARRGGTPDARGLVTGLTRGTTRAHLVRAALEAIAHQVADVVEALPEPLHVLRADGGATANGFLMQFQADLLGIPVEVAAERETTALGAAALAAGCGAGVAVGRRVRAVTARPTSVVRS